ncbi:MAG: signal peptidase I [Patescibacteria group bacterium]
MWSADKEPERNWLERHFGVIIGGALTFVLEIVQVAGLALAIILPVRYFLIQPFIVKGVSMEPSFFENEYLIIDELSYRFREPERGEIVVFHPPSNQAKQFYIKRVIGLPGETVEVKDGKITIYNSTLPTGFILTEPYLEDLTPGSDRRLLGEGEYYLLGDNRDSSLDSRFFGGVPRANLTGRVWIRGLPINRVTAFSIPDYIE